MNSLFCLKTDANGGSFCLNLPREALFSVPNAAQVRIACEEGSVWITLDNDLRDIVLGPSDVFTTPEHRRALIYAMKPSRVTLARSPVASAAKSKSVHRLVLQMEPA